MWKWKASVKHPHTLWMLGIRGISISLYITSIVHISIGHYCIVLLAIVIEFLFDFNDLSFLSSLNLKTSPEYPEMQWKEKIEIISWKVNISNSFRGRTKGTVINRILPRKRLTWRYWVILKSMLYKRAYPIPMLLELVLSFISVCFYHWNNIWRQIDNSPEVHLCLLYFYFTKLFLQN